MKKIITIILDGFGYKEEDYGNAIKKAHTPNFDDLWNSYPHSLLEASEEAVGLPVGQMGGSEVGHLTIGAGRVIKQELIELNEMFDNKQFESNDKYKEMVEYATSNHSSIHLIGLLSDGGVHSHIKHFKEVIKSLKKTEVLNIYLHLISDGRDTLRQELPKFLKEVNKLIEVDPRFKIASLCGRYYAMDRDNKWERTKLYYELLTKASGYNALNLEKAINGCYKKELSDEMIPPIMINSEGVIKNKDVVFWLNFRTDRAKQILKALTNSNFDNFYTKNMPDLKLYTFYEIDKEVKSNVLISQHIIDNTIGKYISDLGLTQARVAETEKFAHVTYFFDGLSKANIDGCDKFLIPSPHVTTYDLSPKMSAEDVMKKAVACMNKDYDFILVNFANADMVGHTGNFDATVEAVEEVDRCLGTLKESAELNFYTMFILADHGNADTMLDESGNIVTSHSLAKVPFIVNDSNVVLKDGTIASVSPAILKYMDIKIPEEMETTPQVIEKVE